MSLIVAISVGWIVGAHLVRHRRPHVLVVLERLENIIDQIVNVEGRVCRRRSCAC